MTIIPKGDPEISDRGGATLLASSARPLSYSGRPGLQRALRPMGIARGTTVQLRGRYLSSRLDEYAGTHSGVWNGTRLLSTVLSTVLNCGAI